MPKTALVAGGGLAGIAAACALADAGWIVRLVEARRRLGGMVASFPDRTSGGEVDNGEHIAIEACTELYDLAAKLGVADRIRRQASLCIPFIGPDGSRSNLTESAISFLMFRFLSLADRWRVARAIRRIGKMTDAEISHLDSIPCAAWLEDLGQTPASIARFWDYFICPALNEPAERASAALAARVLRDAMGRGPRLARFGLFKAPLGTVFGDPAAAYIALRGGSVQPLATVKKVAIAGGAVKGLEMAGGRLEKADAFVLALPHAELADVFPESAPPLGHSPILNAHLWYDRPVTDLDFFAMVDSRVHWVFNRSKLSEDRAPGQHLSFSVSAAHDWAHRPAAEIASDCDAEIKRRFTAPAVLVRFLVSREHRATFTSAPGTAPLRPGPKTRYPNLFLAGAWTDTGLPATMEGAVRSGRAAASALAASASAT
ncbi:MAG: FAD-dependent oxidoreductase [Planctomycetes bacterium]|nr:FAD-dependent oxidoreductase [Planctomycetota bacterium]